MIDIDLAPAYQKIVEKILQTYIPHREVWAFGSRITGNAKKYSDLDLVVFGEKPLTSEEMSNLREAFDESPIPFRIDIVDNAMIDDDFKQIIQKKYVVIQKANI